MTLFGRCEHCDSPVVVRDGKTLSVVDRSFIEERDRLREQADALGEALIDAVSYLRLASTWIEDSDRHEKMTVAWHRAEGALRDA